MASPTLDLLCCSFFGIANSTTNATLIQPTDKYLHRVKRYFYLYNSTVIVMAVFSVLGTLYMLFPRKRDTTNLDSVNRPGLMEIRQRWILFWLSFADIMACIGKKLLFLYDICFPFLSFLPVFLCCTCHQIGPKLGFPFFLFPHSYFLFFLFSLSFLSFPGHQSRPKVVVQFE